MSLLTDVATVLGASALAGVVAFLAAWLVARPVRSNPTATAKYYRRARGAGMLAGAVVVIPAALLGPVAWVGTALTPGTGETAIAAWLADVVTILVLLYPAFVASAAGWYANHRRTDAVEAHHRRAVLVSPTIMWGLILAVLLGVPALVASGTPGLAALVPPAIIAAGLLGFPHVVRRTQDPREPTDEERAVLRRGFELAGVDPDYGNVGVVETSEGNDLVGLQVFGVHGRRLLLFTDTVFEVFEEDHQAVFAALLGRSLVGWRRELRAGIAGILLAVPTLVAATVGFTSLLGAGLLLLTLIALPVCWTVASLLVRMLGYRGDDRVADATGADVVADALEALDDHQDAELNALQRLAFMVPPVEKRIERLRDRAD